MSYTRATSIGITDGPNRIRAKITEVAPITHASGSPDNNKMMKVTMISSVISSMLNDVRPQSQNADL